MSTKFKIKPTPLIVDLDGTLIKSDLLFESSLALLKINPGYVFCLLLWLLRGKAYLKQIFVIKECKPQLKCVDDQLHLCQLCLYYRLSKQS